MDTYILRQPIINKQQTLSAYEVIYQQDSSAFYNQRDSRVADAIISFFSHLEQSNLLDGKDAFLTFTPNLLMQNTPRLFDEKKLVIQIEDNVLIHPEAKQILSRYKSRGFRLALLDFDFDRRHLDILPMIDIMKINFSNFDDGDIQTRLRICEKFNIQAGAYNVNTAEAYHRAIDYQFDYFQGNSVAEMVRSKVHKMQHLQSSFFRLMVAISRETPEFEEITQIVSMDVTLTFSLIRIVNSAYFALPNRVQDIKQALTILGLGQLRHWIYLLSFSPSDVMSDEIIKLSFLRATFCEKLSQYIKNLPVKCSETYLLGMFSTLDILLDVPIADAVKELPISTEIKDGLTGGTGQCRDLLQLCLAYENGEWTQVSLYAASLEIPINMIAQKYFESIEFVDDAWKNLTQPFQDANEPI